MSARPQVPPPVLDRLSAICGALPEAYEEAAWVGVRWRVRRDTFAHVLMLSDGWPPAYARAAGQDGPACLLTFRSWDREFDPPEFSAAPFFRPPWLPNIVGLVLDGWEDWEALSRHIEVSWRVMAPHALVARLDAQTRRAPDSA